MWDTFEVEAFICRGCICSTTHSKGIGALFIPASVASTFMMHLPVSCCKTITQCCKTAEVLFTNRMIEFGEFVLYEAKFFLQVMFLLCVGLIFPTKPLANVLLTWGFLQSPSIKECSCVGSASVVEMKMCIHRWSSKEEQWIQKCNLWKPNMFFSC